MNILLDSFQQEYVSLLRILPRLLMAFILLGGFVLMGRIISGSIGRLYARFAITDVKINYGKNLVAWAFGFLGVVVALNVLGLEKLILSLAAGGGLIAVVLGFAFKEIGENFLAGIALAFNRPFKLGDLIESESTAGVVKNIEMRCTHVRTEDGKDIYIPNSQIFTKSLVNYTKDGLRRLNFTVGIDYSNDCLLACRMLGDRVGKVDGVLADPAPAVVVSAMLPQYIELLVIFWVDMFVKPQSRRNIRTEVVEACRKTLLEQGFTVSAECVTNMSVAVPRGIAIQASTAESTAP